MKKFLIIISILIVIATALGAAFHFSPYTLELTNDESSLTFEYGMDETMPELTAAYKGFPLFKKELLLPVTLSVDCDFNQLGAQEITYEYKFLWKTFTGTATINIVDTTPPKITLVADPDYFTSPIAKYKEEGYNAIDLCDGDISSKVEREEKDGKVYYRVSDSHGNTATAERTIVYKDVVKPTITLKGGRIYLTRTKKAFREPGYTAIDDCDGNITKDVKVRGSVNWKKKGTYTLTYEVKDSSGNLRKIDRKVKVTKEKAPTIRLIGAKEYYIKSGSPYKEPGCYASDLADGNLTSRVKVSGKVNTNKMGTYTLKYTVKDSDGRSSTATRQVYVYKKQAVSKPKDPGKKVIYLTFDDGPSKYTERLLKILDKYGVKATFFVTNQFPAYQDMIGKTHKKGHTIALHTYSHQYSKLYASEKAYYKDLNQIKQVVKSQTGQVPTIVRFPGGTSNTISRNYCKGIMTKLHKSLSYHGYLYCDWNVDSGDAGGASTSKGVYQNVINGIKKHDISIVLQHDMTSYSVEAVDKIIFWGLKHGYTFLPMSDTTPMVQFQPLN